MRHEVVGSLWRANTDLAALVATHFPEPEHRALKTLVLRYGLASFELLLLSDASMANLSRADNSTKDLEATNSSQHDGIENSLLTLTKRGILRTEECELLKALPAKSLVPWVWVAAAFQQLATHGKISSRLLVKFYDVCARGRSACNRALVYSHSQLPFDYTHLLAVIGHATSIAVAVKCGVVVASETGPDTADFPRSHMQTLLVVTQQCVLTLAAPLVYGALLSHAAVLADPLSVGSVAELPCSAYRVFMRDECEAFHTAGENLPKAIARVIAPAVQDEGLSGSVHDRVEEVQHKSVQVLSE